MKKIINAPEAYTDDMLRGIYAAHPDMVKYVEDDLRCYCTAKKKQGKVAIITGGGTGHLPLFLGYVGENLLDGCGVGGVFQSPSSEQIYNVAKEVEAGAGVLFLYGNYTGDIMNFDMAAEMLDMMISGLPASWERMMCSPIKTPRFAGEWPESSSCINAQGPWLPGWERWRKYWTRQKRQRKIPEPLVLP